jgi:RNA polymerase sigma-70 factor (ECF subfamily)
VCTGPSICYIPRIDEREFTDLVDELSPQMLRMARVYTDAAEDAVQDAWTVVIKSFDRFEGRSTLKTWILGITINTARARGRADRRAVPLADIGTDRFLPDDHPQWPGHWAIPPEPWPDQALETKEATELITRAIAALPDAQRAVITLRDMVGASAEETRNALDISDTNQRVLLHRARTKVRATLEAHFT